MLMLYYHYYQSQNLHFEGLLGQGRGVWTIEGIRGAYWHKGTL